MLTHRYKRTHTYRSKSLRYAIIPTFRPHPQQQLPPRPSGGNAKVLGSGAATAFVIHCVEQERGSEEAGEPLSWQEVGRIIAV